MDHQLENNHDHSHEYHDHNHDHDHSHSKNPVIAWLGHLFTPHTHGHQQAALDPNLATERGMWALKISLVGLLVTAIFQVFIVSISGSVALLADTIHNFSDALTAIPLGLAFAPGAQSPLHLRLRTRRRPCRRSHRLDDRLQRG